VSLRSRLFLGISATVLVSLVVTVVAGALLTRRSLEQAGLRALERQVELIAAQRVADPSSSGQDELGRFLSTDEQRLAIVTPPQAELLLPASGAKRLREDGSASGSVDVRGTRFLYAAERSGGAPASPTVSTTSPAGPCRTRSGSGPGGPGRSPALRIP